MFVVRPVHTADIPALEELAATVAAGVYTVPRSRASIVKMVERSMASFASRPASPGEEAYCFVLEAGDDGALAGSAMIAATAGLHGTFFAFRNDVIHQASRDLGISHSVHALTLCSDLTGDSQLSGFHLRNRRRAGSEAALLSRSRLLFAALAPQRFSDRLFAAMAGITDADGRSPFWEAVGRKFFQMDFLQAERLIEGARNRTLIVELMPHYPVYVPLLPADAQAVMGQVHAGGELPLHILSGEGFETDKYLDLFDGGPILQARSNALHAFCQALPRRVSSSDGNGPKIACLVAAAREEDFRAMVVECTPPDLSGSVALGAEARRRLDVVHGDTVLCVRL